MKKLYHNWLFTKKCSYTFIWNILALFWTTCYDIFTILNVDRNSSVGKATRYRLDGPEIECRWRRDFPHLFRPAMGPTTFPRSGCRVIAVGKVARMWIWPSTPSSAEVKERVELYIYSPHWVFVAWSTVNFTLTLPVPVTLPLPLTVLKTVQLSNLMTKRDVARFNECRNNRHTEIL